MKLIQKFVILGEFITLNEYIDRERSNKYAAASIKEEETERVQWEMKQYKPLPLVPLFFEFHWYRKNRRTDPGNIGFSIKFIMDGMVKEGILENDGWKQIKGFSHHFYVDKENPRVEFVAKE